MRLRHMLVLALLALLVTACSGSVPATPTPEETPTEAVEVSTPTSEPTTPAAAEPITSTLPITPTGGADVAMAAIEPVDGTLATVNGEEITWADYEPELRRSLYDVTYQYGVDWNQAENIALLGTVQDQVLQTVMDRTLLRQLAAKEGIEISQAEVEARVEEEKANIMASGQFGSWEDFEEQAGIGDEYFARLLEDAEIIERWGEAYGPDREVEQVHARHILVADQETGQEVLDQLEAGEDWAALAEEYSQDSSNSADAGELGWFPRGMMVPEFEEVAFSLDVGGTSELVQTDFGFHIIQVLEKDTRELDEETYQLLEQEAFSQWLLEQKAAAEMTAAVTFSTGQ
ncbi:MAG: peptidylprolyl isomerase [Anaerolineae bacterium]|nr:peptidylprolyl isomerase [Anaerolineae bacterium]